jgi:hypothetical protein
MYRTASLDNFRQSRRALIPNFRQIGDYPKRERKRDKEYHRINDNPTIQILARVLLRCKGWGGNKSKGNSNAAYNGVPVHR